MARTSSIYYAFMALALCMLPLIALGSSIFTLGEVQFENVVRPRGLGFIDLDVSLNTEVLHTDTLLVTLPSGFDVSQHSKLIINYATIPMAVVAKDYSTTTVAITDLKLAANQLVTLEFDSVQYPGVATDNNVVNVVLKRDMNVLATKQIVGGNFIVSSSAALNVEGFELTSEAIANAVLNVAQPFPLLATNLSVYFNYTANIKVNETVAFDLKSTYTQAGPLSCSLNNVAATITMQPSPVNSFTRYFANFATPVTISNGNVTLMCSQFTIAGLESQSNAGFVMVIDTFGQVVASANIFSPAISVFPISNLTAQGTSVVFGSANNYVFSFAIPHTIVPGVSFRFAVTTSAIPFVTGTQCNVTRAGTSLNTTTSVDISLFAVNIAFNADVDASSNPFVVTCPAGSISSVPTAQSVVGSVRVGALILAESQNINLPTVVPALFGQNTAVVKLVSAVVDVSTTLQISISPITFNIPSGHAIRVSAYANTNGLSSCSLYKNFTASSTSADAVSITGSIVSNMYSFTFPQEIIGSSNLVVLIECSGVTVGTSVPKSQGEMTIRTSNNVLVASNNNVEIFPVGPPGPPPITVVVLRTALARTTFMNQAEITAFVNAVRNSISAASTVSFKSQVLVSSFWVTGDFFAPTATASLSVETNIIPTNPAQATNVVSQINTQSAALATSIAAASGQNVQSIAPATIAPVSATCANNVKDGAETDVDCGGSECSPCSANKACQQNSDCTTATCSPTLKVCVNADGSPVGPVIVPDSDSGLEDWEIALIVLGCIIGAFLIVLVIVLLCKSGNKKSSAGEEDYERGARLSTVEL